MRAQTRIQIARLTDVDTACLFAKDAINAEHFSNANGAEPCFPKVEANRSRRAPDLAGKRISFNCRKALGHLKDVHRKPVRCFVHA
jgi:hypothetical protein